MPILNVCGTNYQYPNSGDKPWGAIHIAWATAVSNCVTSVNTTVSTIQSNLFNNPMLVDGDIIFQNLTVPTRLPIGNDGDQLSVVGGLPTWVAPGTAVVPTGAILPFYDFGTLTLPSGYVWCDGGVISAVGSPINGLTTPDLSGAYICGFGTLGLGDISTAAFTATPIGNANHQINLSHTHTGPSHTHTIPNQGSHIHTLDSGGWARVAAVGGGSGDILMDVVSTGSSWTSDRRCDSSDQAAGATISEGARLDGETASGGSHDHGGATGSSGTGATSSSLSANTNIQPRTQQVRFIIKT